MLEFFNIEKNNLDGAFWTLRCHLSTQDYPQKTILCMATYLWSNVQPFQERVRPPSPVMQIKAPSYGIQRPSPKQNVGMTVIYGLYRVVECVCVVQYYMPTWGSHFLPSNKTSIHPCQLSDLTSNWEVMACTYVGQSTKGSILLFPRSMFFLFICLGHRFVFVIYDSHTHSTGIILLGECNCEIKGFCEVCSTYLDHTI